MATLSAQDRERCKYHLGYMLTDGTSAIAFGGQARPVETLFLVESLMEKLTSATAIAKVQAILGQLDRIEGALASSVCALQASAVGQIDLRGDAPDLIEREYFRWAGRLADILGAPRYGYSERNRRGGGGPGTIIPVRCS
jgi:hypothetical protein